RRVESRADLSGEPQLAIPVDPHEERAQAGARALGRGEPADHQLLPRQALDLQPIAAPTAPVGGVAPFRDDPLDAELAGLAIEGLPLTLDMVVVAQHALDGRGEQLAQGALALDEREAPRILAIQMEEVEDEVGHPRRVLGAER